MLFTYWTNEKIVDAPAASAWGSIFPGFRVFNDDDVIPLLPPKCTEMFASIRLPSAKSDLARLLLLREHGGLYVDAHVGPTSPARLLETLDKLCTHNLILFGKGWAMKEETDFDLMNGVVAARKGAPELDIAIARIVENLVAQWEKERSQPDYIPYDLFSLTGTYVFVESFFDQVHPRAQIKPDLRDKVFVHYMSDNQQSGFEIAAFYGYRKPGRHWSERQKYERFFLDDQEEPSEALAEEAVRAAGVAQPEEGPTRKTVSLRKLLRGLSGRVRSS